jgi:hypothetical protein
VTRRPPARASRRGVLGGLLVVTAAGCEIEPSADQPDSRTTGSSSAPEPTEEADGDPDAELVRRVVDDLTGALALVGGVARARRGLAAEVAPWRILHAAHLEALEEPGRARPARVGGTAPALRLRVRREESALQRRLADAAVAARSGPLASLLATMSAAVAQQLAHDAGGRP